MRSNGAPSGSASSTTRSRLRLAGLRGRRAAPGPGVRALPEAGTAIGATSRYKTKRAGAGPAMAAACCCAAAGALAGGGPLGVRPFFLEPAGAVLNARPVRLRDH